LLGDADPAGRAAWRKLRQTLASDTAAAPFLEMAEVPIARWPLWHVAPSGPEESLLALGIWHEGAPAVRDRFPVSDPSLAYTGTLLLERAGEYQRAIQLGEALRDRLPEQVPSQMLPRAFLQSLYPLAYREVLLAAGRLRAVNPYLLAALLRAESRFNPQALSPTAARGISQLALPTARRLAKGVGMEKLEPDDLYRPEVSIDLGAAYLAELIRTSNGLPHLAVAAYDASLPQALLWRSYCFSPEPEEYFSKISSPETRGYLERVWSSWAHYRQLYS
nr:transglycosylase SLT domain-containing protein [Acidobacteriota bacterium]